jgi:hypothetical protein
MATEQGCQIFLGPNIPKRKKYAKWPKTIPKGHKLYQMAVKVFQMVIKYTNIFHSKALRIFTKFGIFGLKTNHLSRLQLRNRTVNRNVCHEQGDQIGRIFAHWAAVTFLEFLENYRQSFRLFFLRLNLYIDFDNEWVGL